MACRIRRWGNGRRPPSASRSLATALCGGALARGLPRVVVVPQTDGVNKTESGFRPLQASSRDDHGLLCRNRRVIGMLQHLRFGLERDDRAGGQGGERAGGADWVVPVAGLEPGADRLGGWTAVAMAVCRDAGSRPCG